MLISYLVAMQVFSDLTALLKRNQIGKKYLLSHRMLLSIKYYEGKTRVDTFILQNLAEGDQLTS